jgi:hypothetical protein
MSSAWDGWSESDTIGRVVILPVGPFVDRGAQPHLQIAIFRHCEPTGRANARPMTGSAKQSILLSVAAMDCFASLAMT